MASSIGIRRRAALLGALLLGALPFGAALSPAVHGYAGEVAANIVLAVEGDIVPGVPIPISITVVGPSGTGVPGVEVTFEITSSPAGAGDVLSSGSVVSDADGSATITVTLDAVAGQRVITATADGDVQGTVVLELVPAGLPNTSAGFDAPPGSVSPLAALGIGALALAFALTGFVGVRRVSRRAAEQPRP